jgi:hypothetical protein
MFRRTALQPLAGYWQKHQAVFWWLHSAYALLYGIFFMWLGRQSVLFIQVAVIYLAIIWITSLWAPRWARHPRLAGRWGHRLLRLTNYFQRNFYQQILFFLLPVYFASATLPSRHGVFLGLLAVLAVLSTLDLVYEHRLSRRWNFMAAFFAVTLFATFNAMLPLLWRTGLSRTILISGGLAAIGYATFCLRLSGLTGIRRWGLMLVGVILLGGLVFWGRSYIPPVPLQLADGRFGLDLDRTALQIRQPLTHVPRRAPDILYLLTAIRAPLGLRERITHRWYTGDRLISSLPFYVVDGGRADGFRLWTGLRRPALSPDLPLRVDVVLENGQLLGRAILPPAPGRGQLVFESDATRHDPPAEDL